MPPPLRRIPLLPLAGLGIVLVAAVAAILLSRSVSAADRWVNHTVRAQVGVVELAERLALQESAFRGYMMRGDRRVLGDFDETSRGVSARLAELRDATIDSPVQRERWTLVSRLIAQRIGYMRARFVERDTLGHLPAEAGTQLPNGRPLAIRIRATLAQMFAEEQRLIVEREIRTQRLIDALSIGLAGAVLLVVLVAYTTIGDARARSRAMADAHREARAAELAARAEMAAREEAETQLRQIQRMESIGQMTGGIAHDFNNMLAVIIGSLDMARRRSGDPERVERHIGNAQEGAQRAATLVARLLAFARRQPLAPTTIDPNTMVAGMIDLLGRTLGEQIEIVTDLAAETWPISADPGQLENVILNLAINARDAMEHGGELAISTANRPLDTDYARANPDVLPGDYVVFAVADRGSGMSDAVRAQAFDPFFTTKPVGKGTGLGLSQVFGFVKQSGGHVVIEARDGGGTIVRVFLPRASSPVDPAEPAGGVSPEGASGRGERILVVEDDERVRLFSVEALRDLGYVPLAAESAAAALDLLKREADPDLLFTDIVMPGISGPELASIVRAARPAIRVLFTTGYASDRLDDSAHAALDADIAILAKPFTVNQLATRVREVLGAA